MFLSSENSQKGVKNKAALKANNFISPATQGENTIQFHGNVLSHWCRYLLIFYFWKRKRGKTESKHNGTLLSFLEKSFWLVHHFSKEFKNCFLLPPATIAVVSLTHSMRKKSSHNSLYSSHLSDYRIIRTGQIQSVIRWNKAPHFSRESKELWTPFAVAALGRWGIQGDGPAGQLWGSTCWMKYTILRN